LYGLWVIRGNLPRNIELAGEVAAVKSGADLSLDNKSIVAAEACPVEAIIYEK
jgi:ferredoxin